MIRQENILAQISVFKISVLLAFVILAQISVFKISAYANIVLKVMIINPSQDQAQSVPVKVYLPKETKPEDVADKSDLEIGYDTQQGSYFVYGEYLLKPGEAIDKDIELKDIWMISNTELESLRIEALKLFGLLKATEFAERVEYLNQNIENKLNQIDENQKNAPANPERHISDYRDNLKILESVKTDIVLARSLLSQSKPFSVNLVWRLIIIIIIFLAVLGLSFYIIWQKQIRAINKDSLPSSKDEGPVSINPEEFKVKEKEQQE
ncbi:MAG: hypothetical protein ABIH18_06305 [Candidatus Omnitrophota bacterium]